jgi:hypothetical protein
MGGERGGGTYFVRRVITFMNKHFEDAQYYLRRAVETASK